MDLNREHSTEIILNGERYALVPLCAFHKIHEDEPIKRYDSVKNDLGLVDTFCTFNVFKIQDERKWMLAKLKLEL